MNITKELVEDIIRDLQMAPASEFKTLCEHLCTEDIEFNHEWKESLDDSVALYIFPKSKFL